MVAGFAAGRSLMHADELPHADPVLLRALYDATAGTATDTTRRQGRSPRIKRPISHRDGHHTPPGPVTQNQTSYQSPVHSRCRADASCVVLKGVLKEVLREVLLVVFERREQALHLLGRELVRARTELAADLLRLACFDDLPQLALA